MYYSSELGFVAKSNIIIAIEKYFRVNIDKEI